jgi:carboxymethylenebutenolidase
MAAGSMIRVKSRDGFEFDAYRVEAQGPRKGGVIVIQEIFGLSSHVKEMTERFASAGFEAIAPSMFDRAAPGFVAQPADVAEAMPRGRELAIGNGPENAMNDVGGVFDVLSPSGKVFITGYCYGGTMSWLAGSRIEGLSAASCYYGGNIPQMVAMKPKCPTILHFGRDDAHIPVVGAVDKIIAAYPDIPVYLYDAGHGFARRGSADYDAVSDALAFDSTVDLFGKS